ncbi:MAG: ester cyclase [Candidatus Sulfotelmatobacter sp.]
MPVEPVEENVKLMRRWFQEVWNEGKTQTVYDLLSQNSVAKGQGGPEEEIHGPAEFVQFVDRIRAAFSDINLKVEEAFGAQDKVVVRWSGTMTHRGDGLGVPGTGKPVRIGGISIARILEGKIVEGWDNWDQLAMWEQIGAYKRPEAVILAKSA